MFCMLGGIFAFRWLSYSVAGRGVVNLSVPGIDNQSIAASHGGELQGTNGMGQTGFLQNSAFSCGFLTKSAVSCEDLRLANAVNYRKIENRQKTAELCAKMRIWLGLSLLLGATKHIKKKTHEQIFHGIVPGFWGGFCLCAFSPP